MCSELISILLVFVFSMCSVLLCPQYEGPVEEHRALCPRSPAGEGAEGLVLPGSEGELGAVYRKAFSCEAECS